MIVLAAILTPIVLLFGIAVGWASRRVTNWCPDHGERMICPFCVKEPTPASPFYSPPLPRRRGLLKVRAR